MPEARSDVQVVTYVSAELAARAHGAQQGVAVRGGYLFTATGERLARGWAAYAALLQQQGVVVEACKGHTLIATATVEMSPTVAQQPAVVETCIETSPTEAPMVEVPPHAPTPEIAEQARKMPLPVRSTLRAPAEPLAARSARALLPLPPAERPAPTGQPLPLPSMPPRPFPRPSAPPRPAPLNLDNEADRKQWVRDQVRTPDIQKWMNKPGFTPVLRVPWVLVCEGEQPIEAEYVIAVSWHTHSYRSLDGFPMRRTPRYWLVGFDAEGSGCPIGDEKSFPTLRGALVAMADEIGGGHNLRLHGSEAFADGEGGMFCHDCLVAEVIGDDKNETTFARFEALYNAGPVKGRCGRCERWAQEDDRKLDRSNQWRREHQYIEPVNAVVIRGPGGAPMIREHIDTCHGRMVRDWLDGVLVAQVRVDSVAEARTWMDGMDRVSARVPAAVAAKFKRLVAAVPERKKRQLPAAALLLTQACERLFVAKSGPLAGHLATGLAQQIRQGAALRWSGHEGFILDGPDGQRLAHAVTPGELGVLFAELDGRDLTHAFVHVRTGALTKRIRAHMSEGESFNGFCRAALAEEVKRRESEQELLGQRAEAVDAVQ